MYENVPDFKIFFELDQAASVEDMKKAAWSRRKKKTRQAGSAPTVELRREAEDELALLDVFDEIFSSESNYAAYEKEISSRKKTSAIETETRPNVSGINLEQNYKTNEYDSPKEKTNGKKRTTDDSRFMFLEKEIGEAWRMYLSGDKSEGMKRAFSLRFQSPRDPRILEMVTEGLIRGGNMEAAYATACDAVGVHPHNMSLLKQLGYLQMEKQEWSGAGKSFEKVISISPGDYEASYFLGLVFYNSGDFTSSAVILEPLLVKTSREEKYRSLHKKIKRTLAFSYISSSYALASVIPENFPIIKPGTVFADKDRFNKAKAFIEKSKLLKVKETEDSLHELETTLKNSLKKYFVGDKKFVALCSAVLFMSFPSVYLKLFDVFGAKYMELILNTYKMDTVFFILLWYTGLNLPFFIMSHMKSTMFITEELTKKGIREKKVPKIVAFILMPFFTVVNFVERSHEKKLVSSSVKNKK